MSRKLYRVLALLPALAGTQALALGLGGMRLQSALDQPFVGEIDIVDVKPDELDAVKAQIAPQAEFNRAGTERYHHLSKLRFSAQISPSGNPVIRVSSREPMREPYMDFLVEVLWPKGRLVKQYTLLLDPPVTASRSAPRIEQPVVDARPARTASSTSAPAPTRAASMSNATQAPPPAARPATIPAAPAPTMAPTSRTAPVPASSGGFPKRYGPIRPGTGLWSLAHGNTPAGATVSQTAMALFRNNQGAFINGDINRLIVGRILTLPNAGELFALSPVAARQEFKTALAGGKVLRGPLTDPNIPAGLPDEGESRLRIAGVAADTAKRGSTAPAPGASGAEMEKDILLARETSESARQETVEMRGRIRDLESQLAEIQQLLKLRNEELARVQGGVVAAPGGLVASRTPDQGAPSAASGDGAPGTSAPVSKSATAPVSVPPPPGVVPPEEGATGSTGSPGAPLGQIEEVGAKVPGEGAGPASGVRPVTVLPPAAQPQPDAGSVATVPQGNQQQATTAMPGSAPAGGPPRVPVGGSNKAPVVAAPSGDSTWRALLLPLAGVAGVIVLGIGALTWLRSRRRVGRDSSVEFDSSDLSEGVTPWTNRDLPAVPGAPHAVAGAAPAPMGSKEKVASDTPSSAFAGRAVDPETDEADAISEADIYIAYGRYREAEDLLREEIRRSPARQDLKFKLAEAYHGANNTDALRGLMREMQAAGWDQSSPDQWQRLVEMAAGKHPEVAQGGVAAAPRAPAQSVGGLVGRATDSLVESIDPGSADIYALDTIDARKSSADVAQRATSNVAQDRGAAAGPRPTIAPLVSDKPTSTPISAEVLPLYLEPALLDEQMFSGELGLAEALDVPRRDQSSAGSAGSGFTGGGSDLDLNIEDFWRVGDSERYSGIDSTQTGRATQQTDETGRLGIESQGLVPPSDYTPTQVGDKAMGGPSGLPRLFDTQGDSTPSDPVSSQWQMDSGLWDETATKLDLARAYIDMGDKEAAKGILEEVGGEGNEEQRAVAQELLRRVG